MPLARIGNKILFFAHIPKTGGTTIEAYLAKKGALALRSKNRFGWAATSPQHMHAEVHVPFVPDAFFDASFAILRDPVDRLRSEYRHQAARNPEIGTISDWAHEAFERAVRRAHVFDNHLRPQAEFVRPDMTLFRFENGLEPVYDWIDGQTDTAPAKRDIWKMRSSAAFVEVPKALRAEIKAHYAADYELLSGLGDQVSA